MSCVLHFFIILGDVRSNLLGNNAYKTSYTRQKKRKVNITEKRWNGDWMPMNGDWKVTELRPSVVTEWWCFVLVFMILKARGSWTTAYSTNSLQWTNLNKAMNIQACLLNIIITYSWKKTTNENLLYPGMFCDEFGWNKPSGSWKRFLFLLGFLL